MPIVINGNGTITGLAVGGLPNGVVDEDTLATDSVTNVKVANNAINTNEIVNSAVTPVKSTITGGISECDMWRLTSHLQGNQMPITTGSIERVDDASFTKIGTGMSVSSGVFSFPSTGIWKVVWYGVVQTGTSTHQNVFTIQVTTNNSSYDDTARARQGIYKMSSGTSYGAACCSTLVDVTNVSNVKVRFQYIAGQGSEELMGSTTDSQTTFEFVKLAET